MKVIGITGSSGAGKTTLAEILTKKENMRVIDADNIAKKLSQKGTKYLEEIVTEFGKDILMPDGNLDRKKLASKIYEEDSSRCKLNDLTFKYVKNEILNQIEELKKENLRAIVIDAPLLFEAGLEKCCDFVISLIADENVKIQRICDRDNIDFETAKKRLNIQADDEYFIKRSDYIIRNNLNCDLEKEIDEFLKLKNIF